MTTKKKVVSIVALISVFVIFSYFLLSFYNQRKAEELELAQQQALEEERLAQEAAEQARLDHIREQLISGEYDEDLKVAFLTFDDGPDENSNDILDILANRGVKATFFSNGRTDENATEIYQRIVNEGHVLGNHTWSHNYSYYKDIDTFLADIDKLNEYQKEVTGVEPIKVFRFPGGSNMTNTSVINQVVEKGYNFYDWDASAGDGSANPLSVENTIVKILTEIEGKQAPVILMHAENPAKVNSRDALDQLITELQLRGYELLPLDPEYNLTQFIEPTV